MSGPRRSQRNIDKDPVEYAGFADEDSDDSINTEGTA